MAAFKDFSFVHICTILAQYSHKHSRYLCEVNGSTVWGRSRLKTLKLTLGPYVSAYFSYVVRRDDCRTFLDCTLPFWMDALRASGRSLLMSRSFKNVTISFAISSGTVSFLGFLWSSHPALFDSRKWNHQLHFYFLFFIDPEILCSSLISQGHCQCQTSLQS